MLSPISDFPEPPGSVITVVDYNGSPSDSSLSIQSISVFKASILHIYKINFLTKLSCSFYNGILKSVKTFIGLQ